MIIETIPIKFKEQLFYFHKFFGFLLSKEFVEERLINSELKQFIQKVENPFVLNKIEREEKGLVNKPPFWLKPYAKLLVFVCKYSFLFARILTSIRFPIFQDSVEAIQVFRELTNDKNQSDLCLPRSLFAACTSKEFKKNGAVFIGVFLPSKSMHAWVIEDNVQPDYLDDMWINFQPVAILYKK